MNDVKIEFKGKITRCNYNTPDYKIYCVDVDSKKYPKVQKSKYGTVSILGELPDLVLGVEYEITAVEQTNKYGVSYNVLNIRREVPTTKEDTYLFLSEILTIGQATTLTNAYPDIIERVKENRLDDIDFSRLKGIKEKTFEVIKRKIIDNFCLADLVTEFQGYLNLTIIKKIYDKYSSIDMLKQKLKENPYKCMCGLAGVGFKTADAILLDIEKVSRENIKNGKTPIFEFEEDLRTSSTRCLACVLYLLNENESNGHTKMNMVDLRKECMVTTPECIHHFTDVVKDSSIYYNKNTLDISLMSTFLLEKQIAKTIRDNINNENMVWDFDIKKYRKVGEFNLSDEQLSTLDCVSKHNISLLVGFAGVGKSASVQALINMLKENGKSFRLFAPTGKASKVLADFTGENATTIHRGLAYQPVNNWGYNEMNKLSTDIIIVDEFSMVDIFLFKRLIDAIDFKRTKLLLIGDNAQLPSVQCGNLLHDFITSEIIPKVVLTKVFRYGEGGLMTVATDVRDTKPYLTNEMKGKCTAFGNGDYSFIDMPSDTIPQAVVAIYKKMLDKGYNIRDIQVLTAKRVGDCGTIVLNNMIQKVANKNYGSDLCMKHGDTTYYVGDIVMQEVNNYEAVLDEAHMSEFERNMYSSLDEEPTAFVANGETGIIIDIQRTYIVIDFDGVVVRYTKDNLNSIKLGYSMTIHKSQGSSIKIVILCTPQSHTFMLNSNIIYVGLTRMKELCYHLGTLSTVNMSVKKKANLVRNTYMQELLTNPQNYEEIITEEEIINLI